MTRIGLNILTNSRIAKYKQCPRAEKLAYGMGLRKVDHGEPLRGGAAFHAGLDALNATGDIEHAMKTIWYRYSEVPNWADPYLWECEACKFAAMLSVYEWRWREHPLEVIATERQFGVPIINPETNRSSRTFERHGKIDAIVRLPDGQMAVKETKTTSDDISDGSDYWIRLRRDEQISGYVIASASIGMPCETVLYDVVRKPAFRPLRATPVESRKFTKDGKLYANQREFDETPKEFFERCVKEMTNNYESYFVRREIPRLQNDLETYSQELWQVADQIRQSYLDGYHFRNTNACCQIGRQCEFHETICDMEITEQTALPDGWQRVENVHQELDHVSTSTAAIEAAAPSAASIASGNQQ